MKNFLGLTALSLTAMLFLTQHIPAQTEVEPAAPETDEDIPFSNYDFASYRGTGEVLLRAPGIEITDGDLFLYSILTAQLSLPDIVNWREVEDEKAIEAIHRVLEQYMKAIMFAERAEPTDATSEYEEKATRVLSGRAAQMLWADTIIRDEIRIYPEDILFYVKENREEYFTPASVRIRRLRIPLDEGKSLDELMDARARAGELRDQALSGGGLAQVLEENPQLLVDPAGRTVELFRDDEDVDSHLLDAAFSLGISQISEPIRTPNGYVLIELVGRTEPKELPVSEIIAEVKEVLVRKFTPLQVEYMAGEEIRRRRPLLRWHLWEFLPDDADIFRVGKFDFTKGDLKRLYPELFVAQEEFPQILLGGIVLEMMLNEVIMKDLDDDGYLSDPFYQKGHEMASVLYRAGEEIRRRRGQVQPTEEDIATFREDNPEKFLPGKTKVVLKFTMAPRDPDDISPGEMSSLRLLMRIYSKDMLELAEQQIRDRESMIGARAYEQISTVMKNLPQPPDDRVKTEFYWQGMYNRWRAKDELIVDYDELELGQFTDPVLERGGFVSAYYVSEVLPEQPIEEATLRAIATAGFIQEQSEKDLTDMIEKWEEDGSLYIHPMLVVDESEDEDDEGDMEVSTPTRPRARPAFSD